MNGITNLLFNGGSRSQNFLNRAPVKRNELQRSERLPDLPDSTITNILSFSQNMIKAPITKDISEGLLKSYKETILKRLNVEEIVGELKNSDITRLFHKLNDESTQAALTMGFSLKQIATVPSNQLSEYKNQFNDYDISTYIQNQIANLSATNGRLNLNGKGLTTGQLCKILNALTDDQRNALTSLDLDDNQLTSLPDSFGNLSALIELGLHNNQLTSLPDSFGDLTALTELRLDQNKLPFLSDSFGNLRALIELGLHNNQLTSLPDSFGDLSALMALYLNENQLTLLPFHFCNLNALSVLELGNNDFDDKFKHAIQQRFNFATL